eukprot:TRINITY_DN19230_c0_g1_i1.p1 TRINITY_DN19230_c0_g1~~TRINITY_DN19230_c0_g1_i1.p1  ORF type:complete len:160 (-),score=25.57 TRINITY_DN19230_c0_g1_i1:37-516(-)
MKLALRPSCVVLISCLLLLGARSAKTGPPIITDQELPRAEVPELQQNMSQSGLLASRKRAEDQHNLSEIQRSPNWHGVKSAEDHEFSVMQSSPSWHEAKIGPQGGQLARSSSSDGEVRASQPETPERDKSFFMVSRLLRIAFFFAAGFLVAAQLIYFKK